MAAKSYIFSHKIAYEFHYFIITAWQPGQATWSQADAATADSAIAEYCQFI